MRKAGVFVAAAVPVAIVAWAILRTPTAPRAPFTPLPGIASAAPDGGASADNTDPDDGHDDERSYVFRIPSGEPTALTCEEARAIVDQVRNGLAYTPETVKPGPFAASAADWLDPHGLLSLSKDAPSAQALTKAAPELLADIEGRRRRSCAAAMAPGAVLEAWSNELRAAFDKGRLQPNVPASKALEPIPVATSAREAAEELGRRAGAFEIAYGSEAKPYADEARRRFFPPLDKAGWAKVVLASAVRAYVPLIDPHGEWAPFDEESRIYEVDLASRPPTRLWTKAVLTAIGVKITEGATPPLAENDVVLSVANVATAGLPLEQVDQLGFASTDGKMPLSAVVLRAGKFQKLDLGKEVDAGAPDPHAEPDLPIERIAFGDGDAIIVRIQDVRDELGDDLATVISEQRDKPGRKLAGVVLDLRGNGGGSTDGALGALSLFLPGAPLFAMKRRDGTVEIDRASVPHDSDRWNGPVATLVDGSTASAAEMIAGALAAYKRGFTIGAPTFGKGCAQEYVDDDAHAGVLRLTTLVYALADGTPVQKVGLVPQIRYPFVAQGDPETASEREASLAHSAPPWSGPDVRDQGTLPFKPDEAAWTASNGNVGPCQEAEVCKALRLIGGKQRAPTAKH